MKINLVTISGADDNVDPGDMLIVQNKFPFVEWGILISHKRMGEHRYPTANWIKKLSYEIPVSLHLCGQVCRDFVETASEDILYDINGDHWGRVQLNVAFKDKVDYITRLHRIAELAYKLEYKAFIIPYNNVNKPIVHKWLSIGEIPENIHFLYDSSGGRGREITKFQKPLLNYTGYAGGINTENAEAICKSLSEMPGQGNTWIDMESGVRTDDKFDFKKARQILKTCQPFVTK